MQVIFIINLFLQCRTFIFRRGCNMVMLLIRNKQDLEQFRKPTNNLWRPLYVHTVYFCICSPIFPWNVNRFSKYIFFLFQRLRKKFLIISIYLWKDVGNFLQIMKHTLFIHVYILFRIIQANFDLKTNPFILFFNNSSWPWLARLRTFN